MRTDLVRAHSAKECINKNTTGYPDNQEEQQGISLPINMWGNKLWGKKGVGRIEHGCPFSKPMTCRWVCSLFFFKANSHTRLVPYSIHTHTTCICIYVEWGGAHEPTAQRTMPQASWRMDKKQQCPHRAVRANSPAAARASIDLTRSGAVLLVFSSKQQSEITQLGNTESDHTPM